MIKRYNVGTWNVDLLDYSLKLSSHLDECCNLDGITSEDCLNSTMEKFDFECHQVKTQYDALFSKESAKQQLRSIKDIGTLQKDHCKKDSNKCKPEDVAKEAFTSMHQARQVPTMSKQIQVDLIREEKIDSTNAGHDSQLPACKDEERFLDKSFSATGELSVKCTDLTRCVVGKKVAKEKCGRPRCKKKCRRRCHSYSRSTFKPDLTRMNDAAYKAKLNQSLLHARNLKKTKEIQYEMEVRAAAVTIQACFRGSLCRFRREASMHKFVNVVGKNMRQNLFFERKLWNAWKRYVCIRIAVREKIILRIKLAKRRKGNTLWFKDFNFDHFYLEKDHVLLWGGVGEIATTFLRIKLISIVWSKLLLNTAMKP